MKVHPVHLVNADSVPCGSQHSDQANQLGCESAVRLLPSAPTIAIYYYSAQKLILILPSHEGWKAESIYVVGTAGRVQQPVPDCISQWLTRCTPLPAAWFERCSQAPPLGDCTLPVPRAWNPVLYRVPCLGTQVWITCPIAHGSWNSNSRPLSRKCNTFNHMTIESPEVLLSIRVSWSLQRMHNELMLLDL